MNCIHHRYCTYNRSKGQPKAYILNDLIPWLQMLQFIKEREVYFSSEGIKKIFSWYPNHLGQLFAEMIWVFPRQY